MRASGQIGEPRAAQVRVRTPSGRLTPLGDRVRRRLRRPCRPGLWRWADSAMEDAEVALERALVARDGPASDVALDQWEEMAEAAIYCPTGYRDDIRDRLRLLAHFCGVGDPTGGYMSLDWSDRSPLSKLFAVLDWHIYRAFSRMDEGKDRHRLHARLKQTTANDDATEPMGVFQ